MAIAMVTTIHLQQRHIQLMKQITAMTHIQNIPLQGQSMITVSHMDRRQNTIPTQVTLLPALQQQVMVMTTPKL